jgi:hypothetical protein
MDSTGFCVGGAEFFGFKYKKDGQVLGNDKQVTTEDVASLPEALPWSCSASTT